MRALPALSAACALLLSSCAGGSAAVPKYRFSKQATPWLLGAPYLCKLKPQAGSEYADGFSIEVAAAGTLRVNAREPIPPARFSVAVYRMGVKGPIARSDFAGQGPSELAAHLPEAGTYFVVAWVGYHTETATQVTVSANVDSGAGAQPAVQAQPAAPPPAEGDIPLLPLPEIPPQ